MARFALSWGIILAACAASVFGQAPPRDREPAFDEGRRFNSGREELPADRAPAAPAREIDAAAGRMVTVEVLLIEGPSTVVRGIETAEEPLKQLQRVEEEGAVRGVTRLRLTTLEQMPASVQFGQRVSVRTAAGPGGLPGGGGRGASLIRGENIGTILSLTARVESEQSIVLEVQFEQSRLAAPRDRDPAAAEDPAIGQEIGTVNARSTIRVPDGGVQVLGGGRSSSEDGEKAPGEDPEQSLILVTAKAGPPVVRAEGRTANADDSRQVKIFHLAHTTADGTAQLLAEFFPERRDLTVAADSRTNSLLVRGDARDLEVVEALLARLDVEKQ